MSRTKYPCVFKNEKTGFFYYSVELGVDKITGKRIQKKSSKSSHGNPFRTAKEAYEEVTKIKLEYHKVRNYSDYDMTYERFMQEHYLPMYEQSVEIGTWQSRQPTLNLLIQRFGKTKLRNITLTSCEKFRVYLMNHNRYSQSYASMIYGTFRKSLDYAVKIQYLEKNVSKQTDAISKGRTSVAYWTKDEFEKVLTSFCIDDLYEHMSFIALWLYYMTGIRVSEGLALKWSDIDLVNKKMRIHGTLERKGKAEYRVKNYTKTVSSQRIISLDETTIQLLTSWKQRQEKQHISPFILSYSKAPLHRSTINRIIKRHAEISGVHPIQAKGLRHSHASYLINEHNIDVLVISRRLGHSSPEITLKHYAHLWSRNDESVANAIEGDIAIKHSIESQVKFNGNQSIKKTEP
ncbi:MAG: tyrosine-type recombinase/integrase [Streptococcus suis]|jgi:integrase